MLPDSEIELRSIFGHAPVALAQCQPRGEITLLNPMLEQMFGLGSGPRQATIGRALHFRDLVDIRDRAESERLLGEMFEGGRSSFQLLTRNPFSETTIRWTAWSVSGGSANPSYALLLAQELDGQESQQDEIQQNTLLGKRREDKNEEKKEDKKEDKNGGKNEDKKPAGQQEMREQLEPVEVANDHASGLDLQKAQRLEVVGRLAGGVAHDFNNLLTGVLLYCDLLAASLDSGHRACKYVEEIRHAGMQATDLVRQLLAVARPNDAKPRSLSLNEIAEGMRNLLLRLIGENIRLQFRLDPNLGLVAADPTQAQQILLNLVLNARDAMPGGGEIRIETGNCQVQILRGASHRGKKTLLPCVLLAVEDDGNGMDAATRARIFEPFFTTKAAQGTGLGLSTVKDIVTGHGGLIHVASEPGRGTRVTVLLPLAPTSSSQDDVSDHSFGLVSEITGGTSIIREE
jgi:signal transduction histidine kinase